MNYSPRVAILHIAQSQGIRLSDAEVADMIVESIEEIEGAGMAVREAAQKYEAIVVKIAAEMVARRPCTEVPMNEYPSN
jgi:hypothetical protein